MRRIRPVLLASTALTAAAAGLWSCVAASLGGEADRDSNALLAVAITVTALAAAGWSVRLARRASERRWAASERRLDALADAVEEDRGLLIRTLAGVAPARRRMPAKTVPIRAR